MIKKIHYIWLGNSKKSKLIKKCIQSWKNYFPDWEVIEWNESNLDIDVLPYCRQAYNCKKYAFVSDYMRLQILYQYGGLYFDTDVEVLRPMNDLLEKYDVIMAFENSNYINPGLVCYASKPGIVFFKEIADSYYDDSFLKQNGTYNMFTICERVTPILQNIGFEINDSLQVINGIALFPHDYFCPTDYIWSRQDFTVNTRTIHHYDGSWMKKEDRFNNKIKKTIYYLFKPRLVKKIHNTVRRIIRR